MKSTGTLGLAWVMYVVILLVALVHPLYAQQKHHRETLAKLRGIKVIAVMLGDRPELLPTIPTENEQGLEETAVRRLKEAGIKVFSESEFAADKYQPVLHIDYSGMDLKTKHSTSGLDPTIRHNTAGVIYAIDIFIIQNVTLSDGRKTRAITYKTNSYIGLADKHSTTLITDSINNMLKEFISAWKAAH